MKTVGIFMLMAFLSFGLPVQAGSPVWLSELKAPKLVLQKPAETRNPVPTSLMMYTSTAAVIDDATNNFRYRNIQSINKTDMEFAGVGSALAFVSLVLTPYGLAMGISGTVRYKNSPYRSTYIITPAIDNGVGVSAQF
jgi:hypothetical protein